MKNAGTIFLSAFCICIVVVILYSFKFNDKNIIFRYAFAVTASSICFSFANIIKSICEKKEEEINLRFEWRKTLINFILVKQEERRVLREAVLDNVFESLCHHELVFQQV